MKQLLYQLYAHTTNAFLVSALIMSFFALPVFAQTASAQDIQDNLCRGANLEVGGADCTADLDVAGDQMSALIATAIDLFSLVIGVIAVVMIMVGGVKYITSQGDSGNVTAAKNTILYAIIGLIIVALSQLIVRFVLGQASEIASGN